MARISRRVAAVRAVLFSCLLVATMSIWVTPATGHPKCDGVNEDNTLVTNHSITQSDGGAGSDAFHRRMKADVLMDVNERHCVYWMVVPVKRWEPDRGWVYYPGQDLAYKYVEANNPNGMAPQTHDMHPKWDLGIFRFYTTEFEGGATSTHDKGHDWDRDFRYSRQCSFTTPEQTFTANCQEDSTPPTAKIDTPQSGSYCDRILLGLAGFSSQPPYSPGAQGEYEPMPSVTAALAEATYSVPEGLDVVSVEPQPPSLNCPLAVTAITLNDGTMMWVGPGLSKTWTYDPTLGRVTVVYCGMFEACSF